MLRPEDEAAIEKATRNAVNDIHTRDPDMSPFLIAKCISVDARKIIASTVYEMAVERLDELDKYFEELLEEDKQKKIDELKEKETKHKDLQDDAKQGWRLAAKQRLKKHPNSAIQKIMRKFKDEKEEKVNKLNKKNQEENVVQNDKKGHYWV